jgi:hypothetical protein
MSSNGERENVMRKIQKRLLDENFKVQSVSDEHAYFNFVAENEDKRTVNIFQAINKKDRITIATRGVLLPEHLSKLSKMDANDRNRFLWTLRFGLLNRGVGFSPITMPLEFIEMSDTIYYDNLTKDNFMHKIFEVRKALLFIFWMVERELGEPEPSMTFSPIV